MIHALSLHDALPIYWKYDQQQSTPWLDRATGLPRRRGRQRLQWQRGGCDLGLRELGRESCGFRHALVPAAEYDDDTEWRIRDSVRGWCLHRRTCGNSEWKQGREGRIGYELCQSSDSLTPDTIVIPRSKVLELRGCRDDAGWLGIQVGDFGTAISVSPQTIVLRLRHPGASPSRF